MNVKYLLNTCLELSAPPYNQKLVPRRCGLVFSVVLGLHNVLS